jgi:UDPglucose 6-dehydrogenase
MAAVLAHKGFLVTGVDANPDVVGAIQEGRAPVAEPGLEEMIRQNRSRLCATTDYEQAIAASDVTFIIVPTPSEPDGTFSLRYVLTAATSIGEALRAKDTFHLVALSSTVMPESTGGRLQPALEEASGRRCGQSLGLCYNPEFVALGSVIHDMLSPDLILIGESDERSGEMLGRIHQRVAESRPAVARMNFVNAELTKLAINTYVTTKISYANMLAEICERLPGADVDVVTQAVGSDSRIGRSYLKGGLGYGGPCFPRDNLALAGLAKRQGVEANLANATDRINRQQVPRLADLLVANLPEGGTVGVLGLSYKPGTSVIEESQGLLLAQHLAGRGVAVVVYDPAAMENARRALDGRVTFAATLEECAGKAHVLAITTPWEEFKSLSPQHLNGSMGRPTVVDCWRILLRRKFESAANYVTLGLGQQEAGRESFAAVET